MKMLTAGAACVAAALTALAAPPVEVPAEVTGPPGGFIPIRAKTDGKMVRYVPLDAGLNVFPADLLADRKATVVSAAKPGRYRLLAYSAVGDDPTEPATVTVVVEGPAPPGPAPVPPGPQPDGALGLVKASRDGLAKVAAGREKAAALAQAQRAHASAVAAGAFGADAGKILAGWRDANKAAADAGQWAEWGRAVSAKLAELHAAGKLAGTAEWAAAFEEVAQGLGG